MTDGRVRSRMSWTIFTKPDRIVAAAQTKQEASSHQPDPSMGDEERAEDAARDAQDEDHELFRRNEHGIDRGLDAGGLALKSALFGLTRENNQPSRRAVTDSPPTWTKPILRYNALAGSLPMVTYNAIRGSSRAPRRCIKACNSPRPNPFPRRSFATPSSATRGMPIQCVIRIAPTIRLPSNAT